VPAPAADYIDFSVFLDNAFIGNTTETNWNFAPLAYGQTYTASVAAHYTSGLSAKDNYTFECKYLFPPQNLDGSAPDDASILAWDPPGIAVPYNLHGYNIYRDSIFITYIPHSGDWVPQGYTDQDLEPGIYSYSVTGVYDLEPYGHPGETGESMKAGPEQVTVDYCMPLEFVETWDLGSFGVNNWISDGLNWTINGQTGNPAPVAEFGWNPVQTDYEISLESYPLCAVGLTEGRIRMDFDMALFSVQNTGREYLDVQVWNWESREWVTVSEYSNDHGSYDWTPRRIDISTIALDKIFKIRVKARGAFSPDIRGWFVDNIHVYRICPAPENLSVDLNYYEGIQLIWEIPAKGITGSENGTRELAGYLVYRSVNGGSHELLTGTYAGMPFIDPDTNLVMGSMYCYKVTAVYESPEDQCESAPSNEACVIWTGIGNQNNPELNIEIYPNPASDHIYINSSEEIKKITVYSAPGLPFYDRTLNSKRIEINSTGYPSGVYIIRLETGPGITSRLMTIQR
jgi:hypothetical protein